MKHKQCINFEITWIKFNIVLYNLRIKEIPFKIT